MIANQSTVYFWRISRSCAERSWTLSEILTRSRCVDVGGGFSGHTLPGGGAVDGCIIMAKSRCMPEPQRMAVYDHVGEAVKPGACAVGVESFSCECIHLPTSERMIRL